MSEVCPVTRVVKSLNSSLDAGEITVPKARRIAEEIRDLCRDISVGRAGKDHIPAIKELMMELKEGDFDPSIAMLGGSLLKDFEDNIEVFQSHVTDLNCPQGDCVRLAPAPCQMACPSGIDVPTYVTLIGQGRDTEAIEVIRKDNPFPWVCGLVCTRPCEFMCVRARIDTPIAIKSLKAFASERAFSEGTYTNPQKQADRGQKVCIIGAGPAGLTAAYYLALKGYKVTVIEALPMAGGMMMVGIPRYRLPREVIDREVAMIEELGVEFRYNTRFGKDVTFEDLKKEGFDAFFLAIGAHKSYKLNIPGEEEYEGIIDAIDFLRRVALGERHMPGKRVAIVGGGNVAIDVARTCIRLGCSDVRVVYRRTREEMPADVEEVEQAEEEGVEFSFLSIPVEVGGENGKLKALHCLRAELGPPDDSGRRRPIPVEGSDHFYEVDAVIPAIGQQIDIKCMESLPGLKWSKRRTLTVNTITMETSVEGIFAAGDLVLGPATVVEAIGGGKRAAEAIDRYLSGIPQPKMPPVPTRRAMVEWLEVPASTKMALKRPEMPLLDVIRRRITFQQVELGLSENMAREEARRCLRCDVCRRCGDCVEICRDKMKVDALQFGHLDFDHPVPTDFRKTEERCILCGSCAENCTNDAIRIEERGDERLLNFCGTILSRQKIVRCKECGEPLGPSRYLDYVREKTGAMPITKTGKFICQRCARKIKAGTAVEPIFMPR